MPEDAKAPDEPREPQSQIARLFDIRLMVGAILVVYGAILFVKGLFDSQAAIDKGAGLRLNLWTGVAILIVGILMLAWMRLRPLRPPSTDESPGDEGPREPVA